MNDHVKHRLAETVAWCAYAPRAGGNWSTEPQETPQGLLATITRRWGKASAPPVPFDASIRTASLRPPILESTTGSDLVCQLLESPTAIAAAVQHVCRRRTEEIERLGLTVTMPPDLESGRILCTNLETDLCSAATAPSNGFFDLDDIPPWDSWFHHAPGGRTKGGLLYCWVPSALIGSVEAGLDCIPIHFMQWVDDLEEVVAAE
jgi:hypothetical protein